MEVALLPSTFCCNTILRHARRYKTALIHRAGRPADRPAGRAGPRRQCSFWAILRFNVFIGVKCFLCCVSVMRKWSALVRVILKLIFTAMLTIMWFWAAPTSSTMENVCRGAAHVSSLFFFCGATFEISYKTCDSSFSTLHWKIFGRSIAEY